MRRIGSVPFRTALLIAALVLTVGALVYLVYMPDENEPTEEEGRALAPSFELHGLSGKTVTLNESHGRVRVLTFWASWSPYSRDELLRLRELATVYQDRVTVLAIGRDTNSEDARRFARELGIYDEPWLIIDPEDTYYDELGGYNMPETVILDSEGGIVYHEHGPILETTLTTELLRALSE